MRLSTTTKVGVENQEKTTTYLLDETQPFAQVVEERDAAGELQNRYFHGLEMGPIRQDYKHEQGVGGYLTRFALPDGLDSTRQLSDIDGIVTDSYFYDAFGGALSGDSGNSPNNYRYNGQQLDQASGMYYLRARYYNQGLGRFISHDPLLGNSDDPLSLHRYLYAGCDSVNRVDPSGKMFGSIAEVMVSGLNSAIQKGDDAIVAAQVYAFMHPQAAMIAVWGTGALNVYGMMTNPEQAMFTAGVSGVASMADDVGALATATSGLGRQSVALFRGVDVLGRGTGTMAKLTRSGVNARPSLGSDASIDPPGWANIIELTEPLANLPEYATRQGTSYWRNRGHLLAQMFGGPGGDLRNIVPLFRNVNREMKDIEITLRNLLRDGDYETIYYRVIPLYEAGEVLPQRVLIEATGEDAAGNLVELVYRNIDNVPAPQPR